MHVLSNAISANTTVKIRHSTASGGTYADLITFSTVGSTATVSERKSLASGSTINRYFQVTVTSTGSGTINLAVGICGRLGLQFYVL